MNKYEQAKELEKEIEQLENTVYHLITIRDNPCIIQVNGTYAGKFKTPFQFFLNFESEESNNLLNQAIELEIKYLNSSIDKLKEQFKALTNE